MLEIAANEVKMQELLHYFPGFVTENNGKLCIGNQNQTIALRGKDDVGLQVILRAVWFLTEYCPAAFEKTGLQIIRSESEGACDCECYITYAASAEDSVEGDGAIAEAYALAFCEESEAGGKALAGIPCKERTGDGRLKTLDIKCGVSFDDLGTLMKKSMRTAYALLAVLEKT